MPEQLQPDPPLENAEKERLKAGTRFHLRVILADGAIQIKTAENEKYWLWKLIGQFVKQPTIKAIEVYCLTDLILRLTGDDIIKTYFDSRAAAEEIFLSRRQ